MGLVNLSVVKVCQGPRNIKGHHTAVAGRVARLVPLCTVPTLFQPQNCVTSVCEDLPNTTASTTGIVSSADHKWDTLKIVPLGSITILTGNLGNKTGQPIDLPLQRRLPSISSACSS
jgi:hypothetical protein